MAKKRSFSDYFRRYDNPKWTYDTSTGHGNVDQWRASWESMGIPEAEKRVGKDDPLALLGLTKMPANENELKKAYRQALIPFQDAFHFTASKERQEAVKKVIAAFRLLEKRLTGK